MTTAGPRGVAVLAAGTLAAVSGSVFMGLVDTVFTFGHAAELEATVPLASAGWLYASGLLTLVVWPVALALTLVIALVSVDIGPVGVRQGLVALATARGRRAASLSGSLWGGAIALLVAYGGVFKIGHTIMLTFHNELLSALLLAAAALAWIGLSCGLFVVVRGVITRVALKVMGQGGPGVASPLIPVAIAAIGTLAAFVAIPFVFEETWSALDLRIPAGFGLLGVSVWAIATVATRWLEVGSLRRSLSVVAVATLVSVAGLLGPTLLTFGLAEDHGVLSVAFAEKSMLTRLPLDALQRHFDADGDGYSVRLGGADCDDTDPAISPGADEIIGDGIDQDCDGHDLVLPADVAGVSPAPGDTAPPAGDRLKKLRKHYNVVAILIDTVRADHVGWAGYARPTTPNLDKLAARSTVFETAYSVSAKTPTAVPPIFAGRYPSEMPRSFHHFIYYGKENTFLPETLSAAGYLTSASGAHWYFMRKYGYAQGFQRWSSKMVKGDEMERIATSAEVTDRAIEMLDAMAEGKLVAKGDDDEGMPDQLPPLPDGSKRPYYLMVHYLDPHKHYIDHKGFEPFGKKAIDRYDGEIRFTDYHFRRLYEAILRHDPDLLNTIIVVFADHGEAFGEHGMHFHGWDMLEHQIRVPFLFHMPGGPAQRIPERVSLIDMAPTVLDALGIEAPDTYRGTSLLPQVGLGDKLIQRPIFTEMPPGPYNVHFRSLTIGDDKLIHRLHGNFYRLFNLKTDPGELHNLMKSEPAKAKAMKDAYNLFRAQHVKQIEADRTIHRRR